MIIWFYAFYFSANYNHKPINHFVFGTNVILMWFSRFKIVIVLKFELCERLSTPFDQFAAKKLTTRRLHFPRLSTSKSRNSSTKYTKYFTLLLAFRSNSTNQILNIQNTKIVDYSFRFWMFGVCFCDEAMKRFTCVSCS